MSLPEKEVERPSENKLLSLVAYFDAMGAIRTDFSPVPDASMDKILPKITNPEIARKMGASPIVVQTIHTIELTANLLDSFSETGERSFLVQADDIYRKMLIELSLPIRETVQLRSAAALSYFYYEADVARRVRNGEQFLEEEAIEYLLRRGADAPIYAGILAIDGITDLGLTAGFRARQALWDLEDDVRDLEQDRESIGANVLLLSTKGKKRNLLRLADSLFRQSRRIDIPTPLSDAIEDQHEKTVMALRESNDNF